MINHLKNNSTQVTTLMTISIVLAAFRCEYAEITVIALGVGLLFGHKNN